MHFIYIIQQISNLKIYIGQTQFPEHRWKSHARTATHHARRGGKKLVSSGVQYLHRVMAKYGIEDFEFQIIEELETQKDVNEAEIFWIEFFNSRKPIGGWGFNITPGGKAVSGKDHVHFGLKGHEHFNCPINEQQEKNIIYQYTALKYSVKHLSDRHDVSTSVIYSALKRNNISLRGGGQFKKGQIPHNKLISKEKEVEICKKYIDEKLPIIQIAKLYDFNQCVISSVLKRYNVKMRNVGYYTKGKIPYNKLFDIKTEKEICYKYINDRLNTINLAELYGCNRTTISDVLDRNDIIKRVGKLTLDQRQSIKDEYVYIQSQSKLAKTYNVSKKTIANILKS